MGIGVSISGLLLMLIISLQSCTVGARGALLGQERLTEAGSMGLCVAVLLGLGSSLALSKPGWSVILFIMAGIMGFLAKNQGFLDMGFWALVALCLALLMYVGLRMGRREEKTESS